MYRFNRAREGLVLAAALLAGALAPFPAAAAPSTYYAGSTSPTTAPMTLELGKTKVGRVAVQYDTSCFAYTSILKGAALRTATVDRRGRFTIKAVTNLVDNPRVFWSGERYPDQITEQYTGKVTGKTAGGTVRATLKFLDGSTCTTGTQRWLLAHKPGRVFGGMTSQSQPVAVELSSTGTQINHLHIGWIARCSDGGLWPMPDFLTNFKIVGGKVDESFTQEYPRSAGGVTTFAYHLTAAIGKSKATGTFGVTITAKDASGAVEYTCTTPTMTWSARS
jgi:hypothetical protein